MQPYYEETRFVGPSLCDADHLLSHAAVFNLLQDAATAHMAQLGLGIRAIKERSLFWLMVKMKILFDVRAQIEDRVLLRTWPEKPAPLRCCRSFMILRGDETLVRARAEFALFNTETQRVVPGAPLFPPELSYELPPAVDEPFARIPERFDMDRSFAHYTVTSSDIDVGGHMNNAAYPRALFGCFSVAARQAYDLRCIDMVFRAPCFEGETLDFHQQVYPDWMDLCASRGDRTVLLARVQPRGDAGEL